MSTASSPASQSSLQDEKYVCQYCDDEFLRDDGYSSNYCSAKCRYNAAAHGILKTIRFDHRFCGSCFRKLKEVHDPPPDDSPKKMSQKFSDFDRWGKWHSDECVGGYTGQEEPFDDVYNWGVGEEFGTDPTENDWTPVPTGYESRTKVCECGVSHHTTVAYGARKSADDIKNFRQNLSKSELNRRADRMVDAINQLFVEGEHDWQFNRAALFAKIESMKTHDELCNAGVDYDILEWALGFAILKARS